MTAPGHQFLGGNTQLYNVIITAHAFVMIFLCAHVVLDWFMSKDIKLMCVVYKPSCLLLREINKGKHSIQEKPM